MNQHLLRFSAGGLWEKKITTHKGSTGGLWRNREMAPALDPNSDKVELLLPHTLTLNVQPEASKNAYFTG